MDGGIGQQDGGAPEFALTNAAGEVVRRFPGTIVVAPTVIYDNMPVDVTLRVLPLAGEGAAFDVKARVRFARERSSVVDMFVPALCSDPAVRDRCVRRTLTEGVEYTCAGEGDDPCIPLREQTASEYRPDAGPAPVDVRALDAAPDASLPAGHPSLASPPPNAVYSGIPAQFRVRVGADCGDADEVRVRFCSSMTSANADCAAADSLASVVGSATISSCAAGTVSVSASLSFAVPRVFYWRSEYARSSARIGTPSPWRRVILRRVAPAQPGLLGMRADLDDDGIVDLVASAPGSGGQLYYVLGTQIQMGSAMITPTPWPPVEPVMLAGQMVPSPSSSEFGHAVAYVGNAEGNDDIDVLVGDPAANAGRGWVHRFRWAASGPRFNSADALAGSGSDLAFGQAIAAGDFDDDGYPDVLVGAPSTSSARGVVYLYRGNANGYTSGAPARTTLVTGDVMARTGSALAAGCDVNGDGVADALVSSPGANAGAGYVDLYFGQRGGSLTATPFVRIIAADRTLLGFGTTVTCDGDYNGDGYADIAIATDGLTTPGTVYVYAGSNSAQRGVNQIGFLQALGPGDRLGVSLAFARFAEVEAGGDVLLMGEPDTTMQSPGYLKIMGRALSMSPLALPGDPAVDFTRYGAALQVLGDLDGDGRDEIAVSQPLNFSGMGHVALVHFDSLTMTGRAAFRSVTGVMGTDNFGSTLIR